MSDVFKEKRQELKKLGTKRFGKVREVSVEGRTYKALPFHDGLGWNIYCPIDLNDHQDVPWVGTNEHLVRTRIILDAGIADAVKLIKASYTKISELEEADAKRAKMTSELREQQDWLFLARKAANSLKKFCNNRPSRALAREMFYAGEAYAQLQVIQGAKDARVWHQDGSKPRAVSDGRKILKGHLARLFREKKQRPTATEIIRDLPEYFKKAGKTLDQKIMVEGRIDAEGKPDLLTKDGLTKWIKEDYR